MPASLPRRQRVAAYAVVVRAGEVLLSRISPRISPREQWTLPGGGLDHGEDPRDAVVREIFEETGLMAQVSDTSRVYSWHRPRGRVEGDQQDFHALRIVYEGWVPTDAPEPRVVEVDGSTVDAAWHRVEDVASGRLPVTPMALQALADHRTFRLQRVAAYARVLRGDTILLTRLSARAAHPGAWTLPGGGVEHGEAPADALRRELAEECGVRADVGPLLGVHDTHFTGTAPSGRWEDYHGIHLVHAATIAPDAEPRLGETDDTDTTDDVAWVPVADVAAGRIDVLDVVRFALSPDQPADRPDEPPPPRPQEGP